MKKINLGEISILLDDYASQGNAILGIRDSGKSYTATAIAERLMDAGIPIIAFDPIGIWRNLRIPGAGKGYPIVVAGGRNGDLPLTARGAQEIVRAAMRENVSLIVDLYDMHLSKADWREVVGSSIRTLLYENGDHGLRHIFIEEAAEFCPQVISPDQGWVYAEVEKLARMGGNALLGYTLINQRAEQVNKAVLELCDCMILHRQKGRNSITALSKWLDIASAHDSKALITSLPGLAQGECWVWPAGADAPVRTKIPPKNSFHPDRRARQAAPKVGGEVDVSTFVSTMRTSLEALTKDAEANDPKLLRKRIAELERERAKPRELAVDVESLEREYRRGKLDGYAAAIGALQPMVDRMQTLRTALDEQLGDLISDLGKWRVRHEQTASARKELEAAHQNIPQNIPGSLKHERSVCQIAQVAQTAGSNGALPRVERLILTALAQYPNGRSKVQVAILTGYAVGGGAFSNSISSLRGKGFLEGDAARLVITSGGIAALGAFDPLPHGRALLEHWCRQLGKAERKALETLAEVHPRTLSKSQLAYRAGYEANGGGFNNALSRLRTLELIAGRAELKASDTLFD